MRKTLFLNPLSYSGFAGGAAPDIRRGVRSGRSGTPQGMWRSAARSLFNRNNLASVKSVFEGPGWINRI